MFVSGFVRLLVSRLNNSEVARTCHALGDPKLMSVLCCCRSDPGDHQHADYSVVFLIRNRPVAVTLAVAGHDGLIGESVCSLENHTTVVSRRQLRRTQEISIGPAWQGLIIEASIEDRSPEPGLSWCSGALQAGDCALGAGERRAVNFSFLLHSRAPGGMTGAGE